MFLNRFKSQVHQFQAFVQSLKRRQGFGNQDLGNAGNSKSALLSRDQFNTVKMIVAFTDGRKLFAINSQGKLFAVSNIYFFIKIFIFMRSLQSVSMQIHATFLLCFGEVVFVPRNSFILHFVRFYYLSTTFLNLVLRKLLFVWSSHAYIRFQSI